MWTRLIVFVGVPGVGVVIAAVVGLPDEDQLRADIAAAGPVAPVLFVLVYAVATLAPLPKNVLAAVAGALFGLMPGIAIVLPAALLGAGAAFMLGRSLGRDAVERITGTRVARVDALLRRRGLLAVVGVRLVPVLPFTAINYAAGLTAVRARDYILGTALGIIRVTIAYVALGTYGTSPGEWPFILAVIVLAALSAAGVALTRRPRRTGTNPSHAALNRSNRQTRRRPRPAARTDPASGSRRAVLRPWSGTESVTRISRCWTSSPAPNRRACT